MISNLRSVYTVGIDLRHREGFFAEVRCFRWFDLHGAESSTGRNAKIRERLSSCTRRCAFWNSFRDEIGGQVAMTHLSVAAIYRPPGRRISFGYTGRALPRWHALLEFLERVEDYAEFAEFARHLASSLVTGGLQDHDKVPVFQIDVIVS